jgi:hypothetical protein
MTQPMNRITPSECQTAHIELKGVSKILPIIARSSLIALNISETVQAISLNDLKIQGMRYQQL